MFELCEASKLIAFAQKIVESKWEGASGKLCVSNSVPAGLLSSVLTKVKFLMLTQNLNKLNDERNYQNYL